MHGSNSSEAGKVYVYLLEPEIHFLEAAVARLVPADDLGPGAKEAHVTCFIDRQLASAWGVHGRNYRMGPWKQGSPEQGYQSPLTPQEIYRTAIREIDVICIKEHGKAYYLLPEQLQDELLQGLEEGTISLSSVRGRLFFNLLLRNTMEGFFSDPIYGGNHDKIGWKLIGFPGVASSRYVDHIFNHNVPYLAQPVSILDIQQGGVEVDAQGYPNHRAPAERHGAGEKDA